MKVTIINNGSVKLVLKPETQAEIIAVKDMQGKPLSSKHHETTQILDESYPNCLVISQGTEKPKTYLLITDINHKKSLGLVPSKCSKDDILTFIALITGSKSASLKDKNLTDEQIFTVILKHENDKPAIELEYSATPIEIFDTWPTQSKT